MMDCMMSWNSVSTLFIWNTVFLCAFLDLPLTLPQAGNRLSRKQQSNPSLPLGPVLFYLLSHSLLSLWLSGTLTRLRGYIVCMCMCGCEWARVCTRTPVGVTVCVCLWVSVCGCHPSSSPTSAHVLAVINNSLAIWGPQSRRALVEAFSDSL